MKRDFNLLLIHVNAKHQPGQQITHDALEVCIKFLRDTVKRLYDYFLLTSDLLEELLVLLQKAFVNTASVDLTLMSSDHRDLIRHLLEVYEHKVWLYLDYEEVRGDYSRISKDWINTWTACKLSLKSLRDTISKPTRAQLLAMKASAAQDLLSSSYHPHDVPTSASSATIAHNHTAPGPIRRLGDPLSKLAINSNFRG